MFIVKIIGACMIVMASSLYGFNLGSCYLKRIDNLRELKKKIALLDGEVKYNKTPMRIALERIAKRKESVYSDVLLKASCLMEEDASISLGKAWEISINEYIDDSFNLKENDIKKLIDFGVTLENLDKDSRNSVFEGYMNELEIDIKEAMEEKDNKVKLYRTMGVVSGLFVSILIV